ncbi:hypothetical protein H4S02_001810 [Coemansia sp. RSA 2611]|nr:hypothetical protein H4S01_002233 [Coemansia sp. RSA 2610]KAJ2390533.1 hypothetical protein H4S02_001810 [Coemansia sp. RSA 2611]
MALPVVADASDAQTAQGIAQEARALREQAEDPGTSTYIPTYIGEYLSDTAGTLRRLRASNGDRDVTAQSLAQTLRWREQNGVYPASRHTDAQTLAVDAQGLVLVRSCTVGRQPGTSWIGARGVATLESARVALKAAFAQTRVVAQAAVAVPVESVSLADVTCSDVCALVDMAQTHYPGTVARVYVTAASSVLLAHARQVLAPTLQRCFGDTHGVVFVREDLLAAGTVPLAEYIARMPPAGEPLRRGPLNELVRRAGSTASAGADTDGDEFHSACSDADAPAGSDASASLPVQLASLQRAVQGVQSMLRSLNDSVSLDDSRLALAATKSKLAQQADVLLSTVSALSFGVSIRTTTSAAAVPGAQRAFVASAPAARKPWVDEPPSGALMQLLALPLALVCGRPRDALRVLRAVLVRAVRLVRRRLPTLLLLMYRHFRIHALILWTGMLLAWQANAAVIWSNLSRQWQRGIAF